MLAIIPARGGSKGLPGKNIKLLNGKPLIAYTIEAALKSNYIDRVIVSTDDVEIAKVAKQYGAEVPFLRPEYLASDTAKSIDVFKYSINKIEEIDNTSIPAFIILQPTSPLRNERHIDEAVKIFLLKNADSVISYCEEHHPIVWHKYINSDSEFEEIFDANSTNRQEERKSYFPNGAIYIYKKELAFSGKSYSKNSFAYIMSRKFSVDIDNIDDFEYCEFLIARNA